MSNNKNCKFERNPEFKEEYPVWQFADVGNSTCILKQSTSPDKYIWFGLDTGNIMTTMLLNREMVRELIPFLEQFVKTGSLPAKYPVKSKNPKPVVKRCCKKCNDADCSCDENPTEDKCDIDNWLNKVLKDSKKAQENRPDWAISNSKVPPIKLTNDDCPMCGYDRFACICDKKQDNPKNSNMKSVDENIYKEIVAIIVENFGIAPKSITPNTTNIDLGFDSLDCIEFIMYLESKFNISIPDDVLDTNNDFTIKDVVKYIKSRINLEPTKWTCDSTLKYDVGYNKGIADFTYQRSAIYIPGDELGADSQNHREFICGYIRGYSNLPKENEYLRK